MTASVPIWFDDLAVGQADVAADGSLSLRYEDRWLQTAGAFPLSVTMCQRQSKSESNGSAKCCHFGVGEIAA